MIARMPARDASFIESGFGKNPSDARTDPLALLPAFLKAVWHESTLEGWPIPMPTVAPFFTITMALDLTKRQTLKANKRSGICALVGRLLVTHLSSSTVGSFRSLS